MEPIVLEPILKSALWGGERLIREYGFVFEYPLAEAWLMSCCEGRRCFSGGVPLDNSAAGELSGIIIKLIDARENLSIQVHPQSCRPNGKTEAWYIIDCEENSEITLGFSRDTSRDEVRELIEKGHLTDILQTVSVSPGDIILAEGGVVHAIGGGILLCEVQQCSDVTLRVYDYGRKDKSGNTRELNTESALDVMSYSKSNIIKTRLDKKECQFPENGIFDCTAANIEEPYSIYNEEKNTSVVLANGEGLLATGSKSIPCKKGSSFIIPKRCHAVLKGNGVALITTSKLSF